MKHTFSELFSEETFGKKYKNHNEYLNDLQKKMEIVLANYIEFSDISGQAEAEGIIKSNVRLKHIFHKNEKMSEMASLTSGWQNQADALIKSRLNAREGEIFSAFEYICNLYELEEIESFGMLLHLLPHIDSKYEKLFAYLNGNTESKYPTTEIIFKLFYFCQSSLEIERYYEKHLSCNRKFTKCILLEETLDKKLVGFLLSGGNEEVPIDGIESYISTGRKELLIRKEISENIISAVNEGINHIYLYGEKGMGKRTLIKSFSQENESSIVFIDGASEDWEVFVLAIREASINLAGICLHNAHQCKFINKFINFSFVKPIFILGEKKMQVGIDSSFIRMEIPQLSKEESIILWEHFTEGIPMTDKLDAIELANKFNFTIEQIKETAFSAKNMCTVSKSRITKYQLGRCAYMQIEDKMGELCTLIEAKHTWDQLVLMEEQKEVLQYACNQIRYKHIVYEEWGFNHRIAYGKGVSMLFEGPSGTGKTMAAQVVAHDLNINLYKVDFAQIVSKYIGETEKNLDNLFEQAKKSNSILFFDETDALLGKRTEIKNSHDKNANLETSYLLQKMEEYDGITIMTTNYIENIDSAFFRRITYVIHFPFPDGEARKKIWQGIYPPETPLEDDIDIDYLAEQFLISGGSIKNIALTSAFMAVDDKSKVAMKHIIKATKYELSKQNKIMLKEDFGKYGFLLNHIKKK